MADFFGDAKKRSSAAAQDFLSVDYIRDGVIVLKGGLGLRSVLMVSSLNFALKSEDEQDALVYQYESFLNSLDFPLQFLVQSRKLNIQPYLDTLVQRQKEEANELLKMQTVEYIDFVKSFVELTQIVYKTFYAVVPYQPTAAEASGALRKFSGLFGGAKRGNGSDEDHFHEYKTQLLERMDAVSAGLRRMGLRAVPLGTEELIELLYGMYNPSEIQRAGAHKTDQP